MKYSGLEILARILFSPHRAAVVNGLKNIPDKPFIMEINHRSVYDPIIIVLGILKKIDKKINYPPLSCRRVNYILPEYQQLHYSFYTGSSFHLPPSG
jgi:1-acyl-sn-glycerol-3-phosphate acyltransferase